MFPPEQFDDAGCVRGWDAIAAIVKWTPKTCRKHSEWGRENRLPVYFDHRGPVARLSKLHQWLADQILPAGVRERLKKRAVYRRLPPIAARMAKASRSKEL